MTLIVVAVVLITAVRVILGGDRGASGPPYVSATVVVIIFLAVLTAIFVFTQVHITIGP